MPPAARPRDETDRRTEPIPAIDATPHAVADAEEWPLPTTPASAEERAAIEALAGTLGAASLPVVPGADARPREATPAAGAAAVRPVTDDAEADRAADAEWEAMRELGSPTPPAVEAVGHSRTGRSETGRVHADLAGAVVPPAEAWPEDVWSDGAVADAHGETGHAGADPEATPHPVAFGNELAPALDDDATLGAQSTEPRATAYPPAVPDVVDAYALDGIAGDHTAPSAVYTPERAQEWVESAGGVEPEAGMPVPATALASGSQALDDAAPARDLPSRLRALADALQSGAIEAPPGFDAAMRDSEALVTLLAVLLRSGR